MNPQTFIEGLFFWSEVLLFFGFMIFIHEGGHYLACRFFKVGVEEFALGFGPILFSRKWGSTLYSLRAFPLGGFCKPQGGDLSGQTAEEMYAQQAKPGDFLWASWWKRVVIFLAGPGMNYISAFFIVFFLLFVFGERVVNLKPILGFVPPKSLAGQAGLQKGDEILKIDGVPTNDFALTLEILEKKMLREPGQPRLMTVARGGKTLELKFQGNVKDPDVEAGLQTPLPPILGTVQIMTPARKAGLKSGDKVLSINGQKVTEWGEVAYYIRTSSTDNIQIEVERSGTISTANLKRVFNGESKLIGIGPRMDYQNAHVEKHGFTESLSLAASSTFKICGKMLGALGQLVTGKISFKDSIGGPISIFRMMYQTASMGLEHLLSLVATISLMLCVMNLLPLGIVDGGQIVLCIIEGVKRHPVSVKVQMVYQQVGFFLVVGLMLFAVLNDVFGLYLEKFHSQIR